MMRCKRKVLQSLLTIVIAAGLLLELALEESLLHVERMVFIVDVTHQMRLNQHLPDDAEQPHETEWRAHCKPNKYVDSNKTYRSRCYIIAPSNRLPR